MSIVDDTGWELTLEEPATRVVALYGAFNEILLAMGLDRVIVGRTAADEKVEALRHLPAVGTHMRPNAELIVALKPHVVLQLVGRREAESFSLGLRKLGIPVLVFRMNGFEDMFAVLRKLGVLTGTEDRAIKLEALYRKRLGDLRSVLMEEPRKTVFYEVRYPNLLAAGKDSVVNDIILAAGGRNVMSAEAKVVRLNEEELVRINPEVYLIQKGPMNPAPEPLEARRHYATLSAVQRGRVLTVDELIFARPGPRAIEAAEKLARWLHPKVNFTSLK